MCGRRDGLSVTEDLFSMSSEKAREDECVGRDKHKAERMRCTSVHMKESHFLLAIK